MGDSTQEVKWIEVISGPRGHYHLLCVSHYLGKEISDESIHMVWDSAKLQNLVRLSFMLLIDPYPYLLWWGVSTRTPNGCHQLSCRL